MHARRGKGCTGAVEGEVGVGRDLEGGEAEAKAGETSVSSAERKGARRRVEGMHKRNTRTAMTHYLLPNNIIFALYVFESQNLNVIRLNENNYLCNEYLLKYFEQD